MTKPTLLLICTHNAGRSALARQQAGDRAVVLSAGVDPAETACAGTIASLAEIGIDDSAHVPTQVTEELVRNATVVIFDETRTRRTQGPGRHLRNLGPSQPQQAGTPTRSVRFATTSGTELPTS